MLGVLIGRMYSQSTTILKHIMTKLCGVVANTKRMRLNKNRTLNSVFQYRIYRGKGPVTSEVS